MAKTAAMHPKHSSHDRMFVTGSFPGRRGPWGVSVVEGSSGQMSASRSDISTNSSERIRLTILGGRAAAGLYGPASCRALDCSVLRAAEPSAASASMSRGDFPLLGVKVSRDLSLRGSGSSPSGTWSEPALGEGGK